MSIVLPRNLVLDDRKEYAEIRRRMSEFVADVQATLSELRTTALALEASVATLQEHADAVVAGGLARSIRSWGQVQTGGGGPTILSGTGDWSAAQDTSKVTITLDTGFAGQGDWIPWAWSLSTTASRFTVVSNISSGTAFEIRRYDDAGNLTDPTVAAVRYGFIVLGDR